MFYSCWRPFFFWSSPEFGEKVIYIWWKPFFFWSSLEFGEKSVPFAVFFWSALNFHTRTKSWSRFIPPMLKIGQNCCKIANYTPQCSTKIGTTDHRRSQVGPRGLRASPIAMPAMINLCREDFFSGLHLIFETKSAFRSVRTSFCLGFSLCKLWVGRPPNPKLNSNYFLASQSKS